MKLLMLDRDGVVNEDSDQYIKSPAEWKPIKSSIAAIARLTQAGWHIVLATNQSGIARGLFDLSTLHAIHDVMNKAVLQAGGRIEAIFFCPHAADAGCECRKPKPGMLLEIERRLNVPLAEVPFVGDSLKDLQAAAAAGARPVLVLTGKGRKTFEAGGLPDGTEVFADLAAFAAQILENRSA